jgi:hypothetical protein
MAPVKMVENDRRHVTLAARVTPGERAELQALARANDRSVSREVRRAVLFYLARAEEAERFFRATYESGEGRP